MPKSLSTDADGAIRRLAVGALGMLALRQGDEDREIRNTLQQATSDQDTQVQQRAQMAITQLDAAAPQTQ